tara:strand:- start:3907 stop:4680 length:774 start_codon:yes stop_codon:yes gene_type:complete
MSSAFLLALVCCIFFSSKSFAEDENEVDRIGGWKVSDVARIMEDRGSHLYWLEFDLDGEKLDSDYFWNGKSDLYFKIMIVDNPNPIYSASFSKNFTEGIIFAPFTCDLLPVGSSISVTILDDDSSGKVLNFILGDSTQIEQTNSTNTGITIPSPVGIISAGTSHQNETKTTTMIQYPQWLIQNEASEVVADPISLIVPSSGMSTGTLDVYRNEVAVGTVNLHSSASTYTGLSLVVKVGFGIATAVLGFIGVIWKLKK